MAREAAQLTEMGVDRSSADRPTDRHGGAAAGPPGRRLTFSEAYRLAEIQLMTDEGECGLDPFFPRAVGGAMGGAMDGEGSADRKLAEVFLAAMAELYCLPARSLIRVAGEEMEAGYVAEIFRGEAGMPGVDAEDLLEAVRRMKREMAAHKITSPRKYARSILYNVVFEREMGNVEAAVEWGDFFEEAARRGLK